MHGKIAETPCIQKSADDLPCADTMFTDSMHAANRYTIIAAADFEPLQRLM